MAKAFSESEMEAIRQKLIESCQVCWEKYGYRKTNVSEISAMSGISTGMFYNFFPSKEMIFITTANTFNEKLYALLRDSKPPNPTKYDLAKGFKLIVEELSRNKWIFSLREDFEVILRKLPKDFLQQEYNKDLFDIAGFIELYGLKPKTSIEEITAVVYVIMLSLNFTDVIGQHHVFALEMLIDMAIENLFE